MLLNPFPFVLTCSYQMLFMKYSVFLAALLAVIACNTPRQAINNANNAPGQLVIDGKLWSSIFQQRSAEYKALCLQAFNIARQRVDEYIAGGPVGGTYANRAGAIVTDIDETFLDNSPNSVHQALLGKDYEEQAWHEWTSKADADTMPGALSFFKYAASRNIHIIYITNRDEKDKAGTLANLKRYGFPYADEDHLFVRTGASSKEDRRNRLLGSYVPFLFLGDNLADFNDLFYKKTETEREQNLWQVADKFGQSYIVLPNFNYGGWEEAIYDNRRDWTPVQKDSLLKSKLKSY